MQATPSRPKTSTKAVLVLAQPPDRRICKEGLQWKSWLRQFQRPTPQQRRPPHGQKQKDEAVGDEAAAAILTEEEVIVDAETGSWESAAREPMTA